MFIPVENGSFPTEVNASIQALSLPASYRTSSHQLSLLLPFTGKLSKLDSLFAFLISYFLFDLVSYHPTEMNPPQVTNDLLGMVLNLHIT